MAHDEHHEVVPNPDYDGPGQHCLPPEVKDTIPTAVIFVIVMAAIAFGAAALGKLLLAG